jgi:hypothetical protein
MGGNRPVCALPWSAPSLKIRVRDPFIVGSEDQIIVGSEDQRKKYLDRIANNSRYLIFP